QFNGTEVLESAQGLEKRDFLAAAMEDLAQRLIERVHNQRTLAGSRHTRDGHQTPKRNFHIHALEVVALGILDDQSLLLLGIHGARRLADTLAFPVLKRALGGSVRLGEGKL